MLSTSDKLNEVLTSYRSILKTKLRSWFNPFNLSFRPSAQKPASPHSPHRSTPSRTSLVRWSNPQRQPSSRLAARPYAQKPDPSLTSWPKSDNVFWPRLMRVKTSPMAEATILMARTARASEDGLAVSHLLPLRLPARPRSSYRKLTPSMLMMITHKPVPISWQCKHLQHFDNFCFHLLYSAFLQPFRSSHTALPHSFLLSSPAAWMMFGSLLYIPFLKSVDWLVKRELCFLFFLSQCLSFFVFCFFIPEFRD
jgi:hypothetical protein